MRERRERAREKEVACIVGTVGKANEKRGGIEIKGWAQSQQAQMAETGYYRRERRKQRPAITGQFPETVQYAMGICSRPTGDNIARVSGEVTECLEH